MNNATFEVIQPLLKLLLTIQTESDYFPVSSNRYFKMVTQSLTSV